MVCLVWVCLVWTKTDRLRGVNANAPYFERIGTMGLDRPYRTCLVLGNETEFSKIESERTYFMMRTAT